MSRVLTVLVLIASVLLTTPGLSPAQAQGPSGPELRPRVALLCAVSDNPERPYTPADVQRMYDDEALGINAYIEENSYGTVSVRGSRAHGWYDLPGGRSDYFQREEGDGNFYTITRPTEFAQDCVDAAAGDPDIDWAGATAIDIWFNLDGDTGGLGGGDTLTTPAGTRLYPIIWMPAPDFAQVATHEIGHSYGGQHSGGPVLGSGEDPGPFGYDGSNWDGMAGTTCRISDPVLGCPAPHYIAQTKQLFGWIPPDRHVIAEWGQTLDVTLERVAEPGPTGDLLVSMTAPSGCIEYSLEARKRVGFDESLPAEGVLIHRIDRRDPQGAPARVVLNPAEADPVTNDFGRLDTNSPAGAWTPGERLETSDGLRVQVTGATENGYTATISFADLPAPVVHRVNSVADSGPGSLRDAITQVNAGGCTTVSPRIEMDLGAGPGVTLTPASPLPQITSTLHLVGNGVTIDGSGVDGSGDGLSVAASVIVEGLTIANFPEAGIRTDRGRLTLRDAVVRDNGGDGVVINGDTGSTISNLTAVDNARSGVAMLFARDITVSSSRLAGNAEGVASFQSQGVLVGGSTDDGNVLEDNDFAGVILNQSSGRIIGNDIRGGFLGVNVISAEGQAVEISQTTVTGTSGLAIDVMDEGPATNDDGDLDLVLNHPVLTASEDGILTATLDVRAGSHRVELFASAACAEGGRGSMERLVGSVQVQSTGSPTTFQVELAGVSSGEFLTATATDAAGRTSETSACLDAGAVPDVTAQLTAFAIEQSEARFPTATRQGGGALVPFVVLARVDVFADALSASVLTGEAPLLFSGQDSLADTTSQELDRLMPGGGRVYVMGGEDALGTTVTDSLFAGGHTPVRLEGPSRVETSVAVLREAQDLYGPRPQVMLARATAPAGNPTAAWADSVSAGGWAARSQTPVLLTPSGSLHPAVAAALADGDVSETFLLGGDAALTPAVAGAVPGAVRLDGANRFATAARIARDLWTDASGTFVIAPGGHSQGWAFALVGAGLSADAGSPILLVERTRLPSETRDSLGCGAASDTVSAVLGTIAMIGADVRAELAAC